MVKDTTTSALWSHSYPPLTNIESFRHFVNRRYQLDLQTYQDLHDWSVNDIQVFAEACWIFCGIKYSVPPEQTVLGADKLWPPPTWFPGARLNFTENLLSLGVASKPDGVAVTVLREEHLTQTEEVTWLQLQARVRQHALLLTELGVGVGDRVACKMYDAVKLKDKKR